MRRAVVVLVAALAAGAAAAPAAAKPRWSEVQTLSPATVYFPQVAMDARGDAIVAWWQRIDQETIVTGYRWWLPGRGWTPARYLPREAAPYQDLAITPHGEATILLAGSRAERVPVSVATARPGGAFGDYAPVTPEASGGFGFALGVDDVGNAVVAWGARDDAQSVMVSSRRAGRPFGPPERVGEGSSGGGFDVVTNPAGAAAVTWWSMSGGRPQVSYRPPGGTFGWQEDAGLPGPGGSRIGIDTGGRVVVSGNRHVPFVGQEDYNVAGASSYAIRSPLGGWTEPEVLDESGFVTTLLVEPRGEISFLIDHRASGGASSEGRSVRRNVDGSLTRETLSTGGHVSPQGAMNLRGDVMAAWAAGRGNDAPADVAIRERPARASGFEPAKVLASAPTSAAVPAMNDLGQAIVAWVTNPDAGWQVQAVVRDDSALRALPPPPDVDLYADPLATVDPDGDLLAPVRCAVSCKARATGIVFPGGGRKALAGSGASVRLRARKRAKVKVDFGTAGAAAVREAIAAGEHPWVSVTVTARGRSPRPLVVSRRYELER